jgi:hypothetical protein
MQIDVAAYENARPTANGVPQGFRKLKDGREIVLKVSAHAGRYVEGQDDEAALSEIERYRDRGPTRKAGDKGDSGAPRQNGGDDNGDSPRRKGGVLVGWVGDASA